MAGSAFSVDSERWPGLRFVGLFGIFQAAGEPGRLPVFHGTEPLGDARSRESEFR